jgi:hypothetical protein
MLQRLWLVDLDPQHAPGPHTEAARDTGTASADVVEADGTR